MDDMEATVDTCTWCRCLIYGPVLSSESWWKYALEIGFKWGSCLLSEPEVTTNFTRQCLWCAIWAGHKEYKCLICYACNVGNCCYEFVEFKINRKKY
ncbi:uncharacterized protein DS421_15g489810 [Arachis hypogaea]|nr:uncharacterized protein DS421_15g489810 [Arachis hypogaea]